METYPQFRVVSWKKTGVDVIPKRKLYVENFLDRHAPHYMSKKDVGRNKSEAEDV